MPQANNKINIIYGTQSAYTQLVESGNTDDDTIYFIDNEAGKGRIYVGDVPYGSVDNKTVVYMHRTCVITKSFTQGVSEIYDISDWEQDSYPTIVVTGTYVNGLRAVTELYATIDIEYDGETEMYVPQLTVTPNHTYSDPNTEIIIDVIKIYVEDSEGGGGGSEYPDADDIEY